MSTVQPLMTLSLCPPSMPRSSLPAPSTSSSRQPSVPPALMSLVLAPPAPSWSVPSIQSAPVPLPSPLLPAPTLSPPSPMPAKTQTLRASPTTSPASSHPESWIQEEPCSIFPASTPSPVDAPEDPVTPSSIKARYVQRNSTGTQTVEWWSPTHRVGRRVFEPHLRRLIRRCGRLTARTWTYDAAATVRAVYVTNRHSWTTTSSPTRHRWREFGSCDSREYRRRAVRRRRGPAWTPTCVTIQRRSWSRVVAVTALYTGSLQLHGCRCAN